MSASFTKMAIVTASTKRSPVVSGGKVGVKTTSIASFKCTPLDPINPGTDSKLSQELILDTPGTLMITYCEAGLDILQGDNLVIGSDEYPIKLVSDWTWKGSNYLELIVIKYRK